MSSDPSTPTRSNNGPDELLLRRFPGLSPDQKAERDPNGSPVASPGWPFNSPGQSAARDESVRSPQERHSRIQPSSLLNSPGLFAAGVVSPRNEQQDGNSRLPGMSPGPVTRLDRKSVLSPQEQHGSIQLPFPFSPPGNSAAGVISPRNEQQDGNSRLPGLSPVPVTRLDRKSLARSQGLHDDRKTPSPAQGQGQIAPRLLNFQQSILTTYPIPATDSRTNPGAASSSSGQAVSIAFIIPGQISLPVPVPVLGRRNRNAPNTSCARCKQSKTRCVRPNGRIQACERCHRNGRSCRDCWGETREQARQYAERKRAAKRARFDDPSTRCPKRDENGIQCTRFLAPHQGVCTFASSSYQGGMGGPNSFNSCSN